MKVINNEIKYEKICKVLFMVLSLLLLIFSLFPFIKVYNGSTTIEVGIEYFLTAVNRGSGGSSFSSPMPSFLYSIVLLLSTYGGFIAIIVFFILNIIFNIGALEDSSKKANRIFFILQVFSYLVLIFSSSLLLTGLGKYGESSTSRYYFPVFTCFPIIVLACLIVVPVLMFILQRKMLPYKKLKITETYFVRLLSLQLEIASIILLCLNVESNSGSYSSGQITFYYEYLFNFGKNFRESMLGLLGLIFFILLILGLFFKIKNIANYSSKIQGILPLVSILPIFLLMIFIPYKTAGAYYGTIRIGFSWVIPTLLFITIVKAGLDNVILRAAGE